MKNISKKDTTIYYGLIMAVYSVGYVTMSAFSSLYLLDVGLSNGAIGILIAIASLVSVAFQPIVGGLIDKNPKISTKGILLVIGIVVLIIGLIISFVPGKGIAFTTALYGTDIMLLMLAQPFLNALGMDAINYGYRINFGVGRGMGSLGYALGSAAFGRISVIFGPKCVPIAFSISFFVLCFLLFIYPVKKSVSNVTIEKKEKKGNPFLFLTRYKRFAILLVGLIFIYFSHVLINTFSLQVVLAKGGTNADMGNAAAFAAVCELITTITFVFYMKKFALHNLMRVSGIFFTAKIFLTFLVPNMPMFYIIQITQMFGWGIMAIGIVYYVNDLVGEYDRAQGQAYAGMAYTIASVIGSSFGGGVIDMFGVNAMLILGTILAAFGTVIVWFAIEKKR